MKKTIIIIIALFLVIVLIGLFFANKNNFMNISKNKNELKTETTSTQLSTLTSTKSLLEQSDLGFTLKFQEKINQEVSELTKNLKADENKSFTQYQNEVQKIQGKININQKNIDPESLINTAKELSLIQPPTILYSFHLELIKIYYTLGSALKEFQETNDPIKKMLLYNLIKANLEKVKF